MCDIATAVAKFGSQSGQASDRLNTAARAPVSVQEHDVPQRRYRILVRIRAVREVGRVPAGSDPIQHRLVVQAVKPRHRHQDAAPRISQHIGQLILLVEEVEWCGDGSHARNRELEGHELGIVRHDHADAIPTPDPQFA
jgi:hypothetical protein